MSVLGHEIEEEIEALARQYPDRAAILLPALHLVQEKRGYISMEAKEEVAKLVRVPLARVEEVVSFYTMFFDKPVGRNRIVVCTNLTCGLRGGESLCHYLSHKLGIKPGETTKDGKFTLIRTNECLADCDHPPMMQMNERYYGELTREKVDRILKEIA